MTAKKTLCLVFGGGIEGWEEEGRNMFNSYPDSMKKPLSLREAEWGEVGGKWKGERKTKKKEKSLFCSISESLNILCMNILSYKLVLVRFFKSLSGFGFFVFLFWGVWFLLFCLVCWGFFKLHKCFCCWVRILLYIQFGVWFWFFFPICWFNWCITPKMHFMFINFRFT